MTWDNVKVITGVVLITYLFVTWIAKPLGAYQLGEVYAQNMGVNIPAFRVLLVIYQASYRHVLLHLPDPSLCGRGSAASCEKSAADNEADPYDTGLLLGWKRVLSVLRLAGKNAFCPDGTEHQYGDCSVRSTGCDHCDDAAEEVKFVTLKFVYNGRLAQFGDERYGLRVLLSCGEDDGRLRS